MNLEGKVFDRRESAFATVTVTDSPLMTYVSVTMDGLEVVTFPLPLGLDANLIGIKIRNVMNQTGLGEHPVRVVLTPV